MSSVKLRILASASRHNGLAIKYTLSPQGKIMRVMPWQIGSYRVVTGCKVQHKEYSQLYSNNCVWCQVGTRSIGEHKWLSNRYAVHLTLIQNNVECKNYKYTVD